MQRKRSIWDLLFPPRCPLCGSILKSGEEYVCRACEKEVKPVQHPYCMKCGKPIRRAEEEYCMDCQRVQHSFDLGRGTFPYRGKIQKSILNMKLHNKREYSEFFAWAMCRRWGRTILDWKVNLVVPVPMYGKKKRYRGFNQSELLADRIGRALGIPVEKHAVLKWKETEDQKELDRNERRRNLKKAFKAGKAEVRGKRILLVDDVYTTGGTADAIAGVLKEAGAGKVYVLTACIGSEKDE